MTERVYTNGFREIAPGHPHSRTEYQYGDPPKHVSTKGTGDAVRAMLVEHAEARA